MKSSALLAFVFVAGLLLALHYCGVFTTMNTSYVQPRIPSDFPRISLGESVADVYGILGQPLYLNVNPDRFGDGVYRQYFDPDVSLSHVLDLARDTNKLISLIYSEPKRPWLHYYLYYVNAAHQGVEKIDGPIEMD